MSLIPMSDINILKSATDVRDVASSALATLEEEAVARIINLAANTGETSVIWENYLSADLKTKLLSNGYKLTNQSLVGSNTIWEISWEADV